MESKQVKVYKSEFDYQNRSFNSLYKRLTKENTDLILKKCINFKTVLYANWVKARKSLINKATKDKDCYLLDKSKLQTLLNAAKNIYEAYKNALTIDGVPDFFEAIPDGKGSKWVVNIAGFASDYVVYLKQCIDGMADTKPTGEPLMKW